jgi:hypothetical protein
MIAGPHGGHLDIERINAFGLLPLIAGFKPLGYPSGVVDEFVTIY